MDDDFDPYEWHIGDPEDWGDSIAGVPDIPYMGYLNDDEDDYQLLRRPDSKFERERQLSDEAWELEGEGMFEEALVLINRAIEIDPHYTHYTRKAIILRDLARFEESLEVYEKVLSMHSDDFILANKADCMLALLSIKCTLSQIEPCDLDAINEALRILPKDHDNSRYLQIKGNILDKLGEPSKACICYLLASKMYDRVAEAQRQIEIMRSSTETLINITCVHKYRGFNPFF